MRLGQFNLSDEDKARIQYAIEHNKLIVFGGTPESELVSYLLSHDVLVYEQSDIVEINVENNGNSEMPVSRSIANFVKQYFESDEQEKTPEMITAIAKLFEALAD